MANNAFGIDLDRVRILVPKAKVEMRLGECGPVFFLAGPVRGGGDWQLDCARLLSERMDRCQIAIPYWHGSKQPFPLIKYAAPDEGEDEFPRQLDWERFHIYQALKFGCLIFWLPVESETNPRGDGSYARDTRGELGRYGVECGYNHAFRMVVGGEKDFDGIGLIRRNLRLDRSLQSISGDKYKLPETLEETVEQAVALAKP